MKYKLVNRIEISFFTSLFLSFLLIFPNIEAQNSDYDIDAILEKNNKVVKTLLDYRYKGGSGAFERDFFLNVDYNQISRQGCTVGTTIMQFTVHCDGTLGEFNIINPLNDYLNSQLNKFFLMTQGNWNECQNTDYEYFEVPIVFTIEGLQTEAKGVITNYADKEGVPCKCDRDFHEEFNKFKDKKPKKALNAINELIKRNPYNERYIEEREKIEEKL
ncbi:MAG: hypothetical protein IJZ87_07310 [Bacteroidales bacterium]|nr:hypothetical protein [Bacteroidales bacterium]